MGTATRDLVSAGGGPPRAVAACPFPKIHVAQQEHLGWRCPHAASSLTRPCTAPADPTLARGRSVINVIVPESRAHFFQQLGYVLATLLLFILLLITVVLATRHRRGGEPGSEPPSSRARPGLGSLLGQRRGLRCWGVVPGQRPGRGPHDPGCWGQRAPHGRGNWGGGQTVPNTSLPFQVMSTRPGSRGSQRGECPLPLSWAAGPPHLLP